MTVRIAFCANSTPRIASYIYLARECGRLGHRATLFHPPGCRPEQDELEGFETVSFQEMEKGVDQFAGYDVFLCSEARGHALPANTMNVALMHSLPDRGKMQYGYGSVLAKEPRIGSFDYLIIARRQTPEQWAVDRYESALSPRSTSGRRQSFDVVPGGYPKHDYLAEMLGAREKPDCIMFSPTRSNNASSIVKEHGAALIRAIHDRFPEFEVVFRPYPGDELVAGEVAAACASLPRFTFDTTVTGLSYQRRAAVVVTDRSSNAVTFSLVARTPSVFVSMGEPDPGGALAMLGYEAVGTPSALGAIERALGDDKAEWRERIDEVRREWLYHPFDANAYLASKMEVFASGGSDPDWLSVPRPRAEGERSPSLSLQGA